MIDLLLVCYSNFKHFKYCLDCFKKPPQKTSFKTSKESKKIMTTTTKTNSSLIFAIDQGTSSSRVIVFRTSDWDVVALHQVEFDSLYPEEGWCEQDPMLILQTVKEVPRTIFVSI